MAKRKAKPVPVVPPAIKSRKRARQITTQFHRLEQEVKVLQHDRSSNGTDVQGRLKVLEHELQTIGGRDAYQKASQLSVSYFNTSKWVTSMLEKLKLRPTTGQPPLKLLEVGAINTRLLSVPWLDVRAIDLKSQHDAIEELDFFSLHPGGDYDVVVSSMVINSVPDAESRGRMLVGYRGHLQMGGHLFLMLPLLCLPKVGRMTYDRFVTLLGAIGFQVVEQRNTPKVAFFCLLATAPNPQLLQRAKAPPRLAPGSKRVHDFDVVLPDG